VSLNDNPYLRRSLMAMGSKNKSFKHRQIALLRERKNILVILNYRYDVSKKSYFLLISILITSMHEMNLFQKNEDDFSPLTKSDFLSYKREKRNKLLSINFLNFLHSQLVEIEACDETNVDKGVWRKWSSSRKVLLLFVFDESF
jgi:hypothetical protein